MLCSGFQFPASRVTLHFSVPSWALEPSNCLLPVYNDIGVEIESEHLEMYSNLRVPWYLRMGSVGSYLVIVLPFHLGPALVAGVQLPRQGSTHYSQADSSGSGSLWHSEALGLIVLTSFF